jgi:hypothetical protein
MPQEEPGANRILDVQQQLMREFEGKVAPDVVQESLREAVAAYEGVPIRDFVPLFIYRETRERLMQSPSFQ